MVKPEATFINSIHRHFPPKPPDGIVDYFSLAGTYTSGLIDVYYDGPKTHIWVEYKFIKQMPKRLDLMRLTTKPVLSGLQDLFLTNRHRNGHLAWVIVGCAKGGIIVTDPKAWKSVIETANYNLFSRKELAKLIIQTVVGYPLDTS